MVGLAGIATLTHALEDALDDLSAGRRPFTAETGALLTRTLDAIAEAIDHIAGFRPGLVNEVFKAPCRK